MTKLLPKELAHAKELVDQAKFGEALEIIENFENVESLLPEDQLSVLLIKARIYRYTHQYENRLKISERAYQMSQDLGLVPESIEALIGKAIIAFIGDFDKASTYIKDAERRLNSLADDPSTRMLRRSLLLMKSWILLLKRNFNGATESAQECLKLTKIEKIDNKLDLGMAYTVLGWINAGQGNRTKALDYAMKSLEINKKLNHAVEIAVDYSLIAYIYRFEGDYDQALQYCKLSLSIKEIDKRSRLNVLRILAEVYYLKSELNRALKYRQQVLALAEELNSTDAIIMALLEVGFLYKVIGKYNLVIEYTERSLTLSEKWGFIIFMAQSLLQLILTYIDEKSREKANRYFSRLSELYNQTKDKGDIDISFWYLMAKAYMMKTSTRMRDRVEAQALFKELIDYASEDVLIFSLSNLCDLLLEELSMHNDPEILDEINPLITKSLELAEGARNYAWLAETKLLQAKLALIQMNLEEAKRLMVEAQRIADLHGLNLLAWGISSEHDKLLEQIDVWDTAKKEEAPISERVKLASTNGVLERIQGKRAVDTPELVNEQSMVLLILAEGGVLVFYYPFSDKWRIDEDLLSNFLSAFTSFSTEFFSKELDRVKFGDDMMLMESIGSFSFCYLFKGQTYLARQKLTKFTEEVQNNKSLWQNLEHHFKMSQALELKESPQLESLITEIFQTPRISEILQFTEERNQFLEKKQIKSLLPEPKDALKLKKKEKIPRISAKEENELEKLESEMKVEEQKFICVVHKGQIVGTVYICPNCNTSYCLTCAYSLKANGEKCWTCNDEIKP
ncbi:MAG: tetratricopeptide repeat protein [Promethearchaeota archaeon]